MDIIDGHTVWEIKCTSNINDVHKFQLALYAAILGKDYKYKLFNPLTNEIYELIYEESKLDKLREFLYSCRYKIIKNITDTEFIKQNTAKHPSVNIDDDSDSSTEYSADSEDKNNTEIDFDNDDYVVIEKEIEKFDILLKNGDDRELADAMNLSFDYN